MKSIHALLLLPVLALALSPISSDAKVTVTQNGCRFNIEWNIRIVLVDAPGESISTGPDVKQRILDAVDDVWGFNYVGCCTVTASAMVIVDTFSPTIPGYDVVDVRKYDASPPTTRQGRPGQDGGGSWHEGITQDAIAKELGILAGLDSDAFSERATTQVHGKPRNTRSARARPGAEDSKMARSSGKLRQFHLEQILSDAGFSCDNAVCCPEDQGSAGGSGSSEYSDDDDDKPIGLERAAAGPVTRPRNGPGVIRADLPPGMFYIDYSEPGGAFGFAPGTGSFKIEHQGAIDPLLNPAADPGRVGVEFSELLITADSFDLDGTPTGPNTFVLAEPSLVAAGISSPPTGILYDDPAVAAAPGVIGAAVDFTDGFYIGYMGVKWTNDIFTPAAPAYFNVPVAGSVDYQTGSGWFGMFGGVINVLNPSSAGTPPSGQAFVLAQNYPNPFRSDTTIRFRVDQATPARVRVFDVRGRLVRTLVESELPAGTFHVTWDGRDQNGAVTAPGIYFVRMSGFGGTESRRMVRLP